MHWPTRGGPARSAAPSATKAPAALDDDKKDKEKEEGTGKFDPANLERGATALKDIDKEKHSEWAFEIAQMLENTKQMEYNRDAEVQQTMRAQMQEQTAAIQQEEMRRTISHHADQERNTAQHKAQIDHSLQGNKLKLQQDIMEYRLGRENEQFSQHENIRISNDASLEEFARQTMRMKAEHDRSVAVGEAKAMAAGFGKQERENIEIRLRELRAKASEDRNTRLQAIQTYFTGLSAGAQALQEDPSKMVTLVAGLSVLALGVYSARATTRVASAVIEKNLSRPPLVRETSRWTWKPTGLTTWLPWMNKDRPNLFEKIILEDELSERLQWTTNALLNAQMNGTPFRHLMLYGPPGTGKTLFARTLAQQSGLDYAIMSGGDLGPLGSEGPNELHKLFGWAQRSSKGLVLFVDEADAFLRTGRGSDSAMSEDARNALSVFLHYTGTESARISVILATNVPSVIDRAVIDRIDEAFEFPRPAYEQRQTMLQLFFKQYIHAKTKRGKSIQVEESINDDFIKELATKTDGLSGRQLAKLVLAFQSAVFGSGTTKLTKALAETVLEWRLLNPNA